MNNGIFGFQVFRRRTAACRAVAVASALALLTVGSLPVAAGEALLGGNAVLDGLSNVTKGEVTANSAAFSSSAKAGVLDWSKFNIGAGQSMRFDGSGTTFFNLVSGAAGKSQINGLISGSGSVWVINPSGVAFGSGAVVNVGGLFAAAAGSIANADALRDGSAALPLFSSFGGAVEVGAATFAADQVALLGRTVAIDGADFRAVGTLAVGAGQRMVVDEVEGGRITLDLADFTDGLDDLGIELGDLDVGDATHAGDLVAVTEGGLTVAGAVVAKGDIDIRLPAARGASGPVVSYKQMSVASGKLLQGRSVSATAAGRVAVDGEIRAAGDVALASGQGTSLAGSVNAGGTLSLGRVEPSSGGGRTLLTAGSGDATRSTIGGDMTVGSLTLDTSTDIVGTADVAVGGAVTVAKDGTGLTLGVYENAHLTAAELNAGRLEVGGSGVAEIPQINADVVQTGGTIGRSAAPGDVAISGALTQTAGDLYASTLTLDAASTVKGTVTAEKVDNAALLTQEGGVLAVNEVAGAFRQTAGSVDKLSGDTLAFGSTVEQDGTGTIGAAATAVSVAGTLTQTAGEISASTLTLGGTGNEVAGTVTATVIDGAVNQTAGTIQEAAAETGLTLKGGAVTQTEGAVVQATTLTLEAADKAVDLASSQNEVGTVTGTAASLVLTDKEALTVRDLTTAGATTLTAGGDGIAFAGTDKAASYTLNSAATVNGAVTAEKVDNTALLTQEGGVLAVNEVAGAFRQTAGAIDRMSGDTLAFGSTVEQDGTGTIGAAATAVSVAGTLTQTAGEIDALTLTLDVASTVKGTVTAEKVDNAALLTQEGGILEVNEVAGAFRQTAGSVDKLSGDTLAFGSTVEQDGTGTIGAAATAVRVAGTLTQTAGEIDASTLTLKSGGSVAGTVTVTAVDARSDEGALQAVAQSGGTLTAGTVTAATFAQTGGSLTADTLAAAVTQNGADAVLAATTIDGTAIQTLGTLSGKTTNGDLEITGTLTQNGGTVEVGMGTLKLDAVATVKGTVNAAKVDNAALLTQEGGVLAVNEVSGAFRQTAGSADRMSGGTLAFGSTVEQDGTGTIGSSETAVSVADTLTQTAGEIAASTLTLGGTGNEVAGTVTATVIDGAVNQTAGTIQEAAAETGLTLKGGAVTQTEGAVVQATTLTLEAADKAIDLASSQNEVGTVTGMAASLVLTDKEALTVRDLTTAGATTLTAGGDGIAFAGTDAAASYTLNADATVNGVVTAERISAAGKTLTQEGGLITAAEIDGAVTQAAGEIRATADVLTLANGAVTQTGGKVTVHNLVLSGSGAVSLSADGGNAVEMVTGTAASLDLATTQALSVNNLVTTGATTLDAGANTVTLAGTDRAASYTLKSATTVDGAVTAVEAFETGSNTITVNADKSLTAPTISAERLETEGTVTATEIDGAVNQTAGTIQEAAAETGLTLKGGAVTQTEGAVVQATTLTLEAADKAVDLASSQNEVGTVTGSAASLVLTDKEALTVRDLTTAGATTLTAGGDGITFTGADKAATYTLNADATVNGAVTAEDAVSALGQTVTVAASGSLATPTVVAGSLETAGTVRADAIDAMVTQTAGSITANNGAVLTITGLVHQNGARAVIGETTKSTVLNGEVTQDAGAIRGRNLTLRGGEVTQAEGAVVQATTLTLEAAGEAIDLSSSQNEVGTVTGSADSLVLTAKEALNVRDLTTAGATTLTAGGDGIAFAGTDAAASYTLNADATVNGVVTAERISAAGKTLTQEGGSLAAGTVTAATFAQTGGALTADTLAATVTQNGTDAVLAATTIDGTVVQTLGTLSGKTTNGNLEITGTLTQNGGTVEVGMGTLKLDAAAMVKGTVNAVKVDNAALLTQEGGVLAVNEVAGVFRQTAGAIDKLSGDTLAFGSTVEQDGTGTIGSAATAVSVADTLTQTAGEIDASTLTLKSGGSVAGTVTVTAVDARSDEGALQAVAQSGGTLTAGTVTAATFAQTGGSLTADTLAAAVTQNGADAVLAATTIDGTAIQTLGTLSGKTTNGDLEITGALTQNGGTVEVGMGTLKLDAVAMVKGTVTAEKVDNTALLTQEGGVLAVNEVSGAFRQTAGSADRMSGGTLAFGSTVEQDGTGTIGSSEAAVSVADTLTQTVGEIAASTLTLDVASTVKGTVNAAKVDNAALLTQEGGVLAVNEVAGAFRQTAGAIDKLSGDTLAFGSTVEQDGTGTIGSAATAVRVADTLTQTAGEIDALTLTLDAASIVKGTVTAEKVENAALLTQEGGVLAVNEVSGAFRQTAGAIDRMSGDTLAFGSTVEQDGTGAMGSSETAVSVAGALDQNAGVLTATTLTLGADATVAASVTAERIVATGRTLTQDGAGAVTVTGSDGITAAKVVQTSPGTIKADRITADVTQTDGTLTANDADGLTINGAVNQNGANAVIGEMGKDTFLNGEVAQTAGTILGRNLTLHDSVVQGGEASIQAGNLALDNESADYTILGSQNEIGGVSGRAKSVSFDNGENDLVLNGLEASGTVVIKAHDIKQENGTHTVKVDNGVVSGSATELTAGVSGSTVDLSASGRIGGGAYDYVVVGGGNGASVTAHAQEDLSIASAQDRNLTVAGGGISGKDVSLYSRGSLKTEGTIAASGSLTMTVRGHDGEAKVGIGAKRLQVNNFHDGDNPLLAVYETGGTWNPDVANLPNGAVVFIDGRLAGGDLQTISKLGALEAFPVQTPELKSEQGVFGNPAFLHDELDVANPIAIGAIDFLLLDVPRLVLSTDFPAEVDTYIAANGLNPTTSYWFGQGGDREADGSGEGGEASADTTQETDK